MSFTFNKNLISQILAIVVVLTGISLSPEESSHIVDALLTTGWFISIIIGAVAHFYNPDGTPSTTKKENDNENS